MQTWQFPESQHHSGAQEVFWPHQHYTFGYIEKTKNLN